MLETAAPASKQPMTLSWLTNWVSQPLEVAPGFDIDSIKPAPRPALVSPDDLLEITVWDLYEPGKPHSFPVRVSGRRTVEVPFLGEVSVDGRTMPQVETAVADAFRNGEYLLNPRVLVRSLDPAMLKVEVTGAVNRGGFVELARTDPSVYAAILSAGGLKKSAGTQLGITRRAALVAAAQSDHGVVSVGQTAGRMQRPGESSIGPPQTPGAPHPAQHANSLDEVSVAPTSSPDRAAAADRPLYSVAPSRGPETPTSSQTPSTNVPINAPARAPAPVPAHPPRSNRAAGEADPSTLWYDVSLADDREKLKLLTLAEGDIVVVKAATMPLRIGGVVNRPGAFPLPAGKSLNVWQAVELAGGIRDETIPLNITLVRPAAEGRSAQRWYLNVDAYQRHPTSSPWVEPGDVLHVEPTTGSKIKRAVGDLWTKS